MNNWTEIEPPELKIQCKGYTLRRTCSPCLALTSRSYLSTPTFSVNKTGKKRFSAAYQLSVSDDMPYVGYSKSYVKTIKRKSVNASLKL